MEFSLWIEAEHVEDPITDFCNVVVSIADGTRWALNVWTFDFFTTARGQPELSASPALAQAYILPPDLFVADLSRQLLEEVIGDILTHGSVPSSWEPADHDDGTG